MSTLTPEQLDKVKAAYKLFDELTDDLEAEHPGRTDHKELYDIWSSLYEILEERLGENFGEEL
jgi:hypothetical protein